MFEHVLKITGLASYNIIIVCDVPHWKCHTHALQMTIRSQDNIIEFIWLPVGLFVVPAQNV